MKKKSYASTDSVAASSDGPRPNTEAAIMMVSRYEHHEVRQRQLAAADHTHCCRCTHERHGRGVPRHG